MAAGFGGAVSFRHVGVHLHARYRGTEKIHRQGFRHFHDGRVRRGRFPFPPGCSGGFAGKLALVMDACFSLRTGHAGLRPGRLPRQKAGYSQKILLETMKLFNSIQIFFSYKLSSSHKNRYIISTINDISI